MAPTAPDPLPADLAEYAEQILTGTDLAPAQAAALAATPLPHPEQATGQPRPAWVALRTGWTSTDLAGPPPIPPPPDQDTADQDTADQDTANPSDTEGTP